MSKPILSDAGPFHAWLTGSPAHYLLTLKSAIASGNLAPVIDRSCDLSEIPIALRRLEQRQVSGKISIRLV